MKREKYYSNLKIRDEMSLLKFKEDFNFEINNYSKSEILDTLQCNKFKFRVRKIGF